MILIIGGGKAFGGTAVILVPVAFILAAIAIYLVVLRFYKTRSNHVFKWDLFWVVVATVSNRQENSLAADNADVVWLAGILLQVLGLFSTLNGLGRSKSELSQDQVELALKFAWIGIATGVFSLGFGKFAIIALYLQIAKAAARKERIFLWIMAVIVGVAGIAQLVLIVIQCDPLPRLWAKSIPGSCPGSLVSTRFGYFQGAFSAFTDLVLSLYPITIIMDMKGSKATKISICAVMAGGLLPFTAAVGRAIHLQTLEHLDDPTRQLVPLCLWAITEQWFVIILGCLPPLRSYFAKFFSGLASTPIASRAQSNHAPRQESFEPQTSSIMTDLTLDATRGTPKTPCLLVGIVETEKEHDIDLEHGL
ncbi:hypothetical protein B9Z65_434 [Elsinoe australis]|uniref:Rhodopsin domain-containing protein n=1 Tax=Elsinoe australis TaxID=40998 RepID=A0A2P8AIM1_9PEZI|nr:hypothetical protein B9Z65_434 [Elsinoe australis]